MCKGCLICKRDDSGYNLRYAYQAIEIIEGYRNQLSQEGPIYPDQRFVKLLVQTPCIIPHLKLVLRDEVYEKLKLNIEQFVA